MNNTIYREATVLAS